MAEELKKLQQKESEALSLAHDKIAEAAAAIKGDDKSNKGHSNTSVNKEIESLRHKLEERRQVRQLPESVEDSRNNVIRCLRENDRRPLNCWEEVENFKAEVKKLEKGWVDKVIS